MEHSELSDNRRYTSTIIISETSLKYDQHILQSDIDPKILQLNLDQNTDFFQSPQPQQHNITHDQQQDTTLQNIQDSSDADTIQNVSKLSDINTNNPQSFTITNDSNVLQVPVRQVTQNTNDDLTQANTSTLSLSHTNINQPLQIQQTSPVIMIHFLLRNNILLILLHVTLLNKVLLIQMVQLHSLNPT